MRTKFCGVAIAICLFTATSPGHAAYPVIAKPWNAESIGVGFHESVKRCISSTIGASNTWNAVSADFFFLTETIATHKRAAEQTQAFNLKNVTIEDKASLDDVDALMETRRVFIGDYMTNADIRVRTSRMDQGTAVPGTFICTTSSTIPSDRYDWESAILHELGHVIGFNDVKEPSCSMHESVGLGQMRRVPCAAEKTEFLAVYGLPLKILGLENVAGPQGVSIPARIFYQGAPTFPVTRTTANTSCPSGWSCGPYNGTYTNLTPSPLTLNFKCTNPDPMPTATFAWRTSLKDASGRVTNTVEHTSTCTRPAGTKVPNRSPGQPGQPKIVITQ